MEIGDELGVTPVADLEVGEGRRSTASPSNRADPGHVAQALDVMSHTACPIPPPLTVPMRRLKDMDSLDRDLLSVLRGHRRPLRLSCASWKGPVRGVCASW